MSGHRQRESRVGCCVYRDYHGGINEKDEYIA